MLTNRDIRQLIQEQKKVFATKDDLKNFATKDDFKEVGKNLEEIRKEFRATDAKLFAGIYDTKEDVRILKQNTQKLEIAVRTLTGSVDRLVKSVEDFKQEYFMLTEKLNRHEKWIQQIAKKVGVELKY